jgi:hypothetical protein
MTGIMTAAYLSPADKHVVRPLHGDIRRAAEQGGDIARDGKPHDKRERCDFSRRRICRVEHN